MKFVYECMGFNGKKWKRITDDTHSTPLDAWAWMFTKKYLSEYYSHWAVRQTPERDHNGTTIT